jgi:hypothetical protein
VCPGEMREQERKVDDFGMTPKSWSTIPGQSRHVEERVKVTGSRDRTEYSAHLLRRSKGIIMLLEYIRLINGLHVRN